VFVAEGPHARPLGKPDPVTRRVVLVQERVSGMYDTMILQASERLSCQGIRYLLYHYTLQ
jgi:hypothetical protein